jgi:predicted SprT family Zn-dependent metalloprotease
MKINKRLTHEIENFTEKFLGKKIKIKYGVDEKTCAWIFYLTGPIFLDRRWVKETNRAEILGAILHEIGHIKTTTETEYFKNESLAEYKAQMWALKTAEFKHLDGIKKVLLKDFEEWLTGDKRTKYYRAAKMYKDGHMEY